MGDGTPAAPSSPLPLLLQTAQKKFPEALATLEAAMRIPGVAAAGGAAAGGGAKGGAGGASAGGRVRGGAAASAAPSSSGHPPVSLNDRAGIYVLLAEVQLELGNVAGASATIAEAMAEFAVRSGGGGERGGGGRNDE